jgi:D-lactate dehydrogenase (cytochrome)
VASAAKRPGLIPLAEKWALAFDFALFRLIQENLFMSHSTPGISTESAAFPDALLQAFMQLLPGRCSCAQAVRAHHGRDESFYDPLLPDVVLFAQSTEEVAAIVKLCTQYRVPLIPYGAGSSLEGHLLPVAGGVSLDLSQMNQIVQIYPQDLCATVQAGVTRKQLNAALHGSGLFFPIDPGADATLGGMSATRASGTNAVRYGSMRENVLALTVVTASGQVIHTGTRAKKSAAGYDLTRLMVGSEGTLGVITEITVKLWPVPEAISAAVCSFASTGDAVNCVMQTIQAGLPVARVEFLDENSVRAINDYSQLTLPQKPLLLFEFHGSHAGVQEQAELVGEIAQAHGASGFEWASRPEARSRLWAARHNAYFALLQMLPGARAISTDCCVPISQLAESILATRRDCEQTGLVYAIIGHVGDGNFHVLMLIKPNDAHALAKAEAVNQRMVTRALAQGGTCTGEHGIGLHKMDFLVQEYGAETVQMMRLIKQAWDPDNIFNPGKIFHFQADGPVSGSYHAS